MNKQLTPETMTDIEKLANSLNKENHKLKKQNKQLFEALEATLFDVERRCIDLELEPEKYSTWIKATEAIKKAREI